MRLAVVALLAALGWQASVSQKILAFFPFPGKSHQRVIDPILRELGNRGFHILAFKGIPLANPPKNYREIIPALSFMTDNSQGLDMIEFGKLGALGQHIALNEMGLFLCENVFSSREFQDLLSSQEKFDLVLHEALFIQEPAVALAHRFRAPHVLVMPLGNYHWTSYVMSNPFNPSYIPEFKAVASDVMTFSERLYNTYVTLLTILVSELYYLDKFQKIADTHIRYPGWEARPPLRELLYNTSLALQNSHFSMNGPAPTAPNIVNIGGIHIVPGKPLPQELQTWMDGAKEGVIYFSYGTVMKTDLIDPKVKKHFAAAFGRLKQRVIWKNDLDIPEKPSNVLVSKWLPQQEILAHKNCRLFITHGGFLSVSEAVHFGVPLLGTPFFGDQQNNLWNAVREGYGLQLDYTNLTEQSIFWAVNHILNTPRYGQAVRLKSARFRDRPQEAGTEAAFWVGYVARHHGAPHLRPAASRLRWYQSLLLDVGLVLGGTALLVLAALCLLLRRLYLLLTCRSAPDKRPKYKTN